MSASMHVMARHHLLDGLHPEPPVRREVAALFVLGVLSAIVCVATSGWIAVLAAVAALVTPALGRALLALPETDAAITAPRSDGLG